MKSHVLKTLNTVGLALISTLFGACSLFDKADDVNFDATLDEVVTVTEPDAGENVAYHQIILLDATTNADIDKYQNKISGFTVKKISYQVVSFTGAASTFSGTLSFGDEGTSTPTVVATVSNLNLQQALASGQIFDLPVNQADIDKISSLLKDDKAVKIYLDGTLSTAPISSNILVIMDVSVKADAL